MKQINFLLLPLFLQFILGCQVSASNVKMPKEIKKFIIDTFPNLVVSSSVSDTDWRGRDIYRVRFTNGDKIRFNTQWQWLKLSMTNSSIPDSVLPKISHYIKKNYSNVRLLEISKASDGYEVELSNGLELQFDYQFNITDIDE